MKIEELFTRFEKHNVEKGIRKQFDDDECLYGVVVFSKDSFTKEYSLDSRSYIVRSDNKRFIPGQAGNSILASNRDGSDVCIRLDWILENNDCRVENCYISNEKGACC